jgi:hypothetical protein
VAAGVTIDDVDDGPQIDPLGNLVAGAIAFFTGDGTYDSDDVYGALAGRHSDAAGKVPPRSTAVTGAATNRARTQRDRQLQ